MTIVAPFFLTTEEKQSPLFRKLMIHWNERLDTMRMKNDGDMGPVETAHLRGKLSTVKENLRLANDTPVIEL